MVPPRASKQENTTEAVRERMFEEKGWFGFRILVWGKYFSAPLYAEMYKRFGILQDEFAVLSCLYENESLSAKTICALTGRPKNSISRGVARLLASGRIKRVTNQNDRRESVLSLLAEGRKLYERILPICRERERVMLRALSADDLEKLHQILLKLNNSYEESPDSLGTDD